MIVGAYELLDLLPVVALGDLLVVECGLVKVRHVAIVPGLCQKKGWLLSIHLFWMSSALINIIIFIDLDSISC